MPNDLPARFDPALPRETPPGGGAAVHAEPARAAELPFEQPGVDWRRYLAAVWRYRWAVLAVVVLGTAGGVVGARYINAVYEAHATIWIEASTPDVARQGPIRTGGLLASEAWVDLLRSYLVLDHVVRRLNLYVQPKDPQDAGALADFELQERMRPGRYRLVVDGSGRLFQLWGAGEELLQSGRVGDSVGPALGFAWVPAAAEMRAGREIEFELGTPRDAATRLAEELETRIDPNRTFLRLALRGQDPERAANILNAITDRYLEVAAELKSGKLKELTRILDEQLTYAQRQLAEAEAALEAFRVQTITLPSEPSTPVTPGLDITRDPAFTNYFNLQIEREGLRRDRESIARVLAQAADSGLSIEGLEVIPAVRGSSELMTALSELTTKRAELRELRYRYSQEYAPVREVGEAVATLEGRTIPVLAGRLIDELAAREAELGGLVDAASGQLSEIPPRSIDEAKLERTVRIAENLYTTLQSRYEEARLAAASSIPDVRVLDAAVPPSEPVNGQEKPRLILMALLASLGLAGLGAVMLDRIDPRLAYPEQVSRELGLPVLGTVPHVSGRSPWLGIQNTAEVIEAFRVIRLNVLNAYGTAGPVVFAVTSPEPEDGKSFVAANLGLAFADMGRRTLVIDADVRRGRMHRLLGGLRKPGLIDHLAGEVSREQIVVPTKHGPLYRIASGTRRQDGPELLQSSAMAALVMQLRSQFDVIILDTAPLAAGVDPLALGTLTGNLLLVVRTGSTDRALTEAKLDMLDRLPVRILGAVLNDVPTKRVYGYYYRRYRYTAGYETFDEEPYSGPVKAAESVVVTPRAGSGKRAGSESEGRAAAPRAIEIEPDAVTRPEPEAVARPEPQAAVGVAADQPRGNGSERETRASRVDAARPQPSAAAKSSAGADVGAPASAEVGPPGPTATGPDARDPLDAFADRLEAFRQHQRRNHQRYYK
jgi:capsular exopolysaccharide synthesis family protein